jgi:hypothetical protein
MMVIKNSTTGITNQIPILPNIIGRINATGIKRMKALNVVSIKEDLRFSIDWKYFTNAMLIAVNI